MAIAILHRAALAVEATNAGVARAVARDALTVGSSRVSIVAIRIRGAGAVGRILGGRRGSAAVRTSPARVALARALRSANAVAAAIQSGNAAAVLATSTSVADALAAHALTSVGSGVSPCAISVALARAISRLQSHAAAEAREARVADASASSIAGAVAVAVLDRAALAVGSANSRQARALSVDTAAIGVERMSPVAVLITVAFAIGRVAWESIPPAVAPAMTPLAMAPAVAPLAPVVAIPWLAMAPLAVAPLAVAAPWVVVAPLVAPLTPLSGEVIKVGHSAKAGRESRPASKAGVASREVGEVARGVAVAKVRVAVARGGQDQLLQLLKSGQNVAESARVANLSGDS